MNATIKPAWCYIAIDETRGWHLITPPMQHIERIYTVYAFNRNAPTHCCELTPSYWLEAIEFQPVIKDSASDAEREAIYEEVMCAPVYESSHYRHVKNVEAMIARTPALFAEFTGDLEDAEDMNDAVSPPEEVYEEWHRSPKF